MNKYFLTDGGGKYIRYDRQSNKYVQVNNMAYAESWDSFGKAEKIRKSSLTRELKHKFYTITLEVPDELAQAESEKPAENQVEEQKIAEAIDGVFDSNFSERIVKILRCAEQFLLRKDELVNQQSNIDKEIADIQHYIEQRNLNARDGFKVYKRLQNILIKRRSVKDELLILKIIEDCKMEPDSIAKTINRINGLSGRKYSPRVLSELFESGVIKIKDGENVG